MNVHLREPGREEVESIASGARAAVAGGYSTIAAMPDTDPPTDTEAQAEYLLLHSKDAGYANVLPVGTLTVGREGTALSEMGRLAGAGAVAFTDDDHTLTDTSLFRKALMYAAMIGRPVIDHAEDPSLAKGVAHAGFTSVRLGLSGIQAAAEEIAVARALILARDTKARLHFAHVTTSGAVAQIRAAKRQGIAVTAAVTPHHLLLTHDHVATFDASAYKVSPPLRSPDHIKALTAGLMDGTLDCVASDHNPCSLEEKAMEFDRAPFGVIGLETTAALIYTKFVEPDVFDVATMVRVLAVNPADALGLAAKRDLAPETDADITLFDPQAKWTVDRTKFHSKGMNTPFHGWTLTGRARYVVVGGVLYDCDDL